MLKISVSLLAAGLASLPLLADQQPQQREEPVGLILSPGGGKLLRANVETPLAARAGDLLFTGDGLKTEASPASFLFCPAKTLQTLSPAGELRFDAARPKVKSGKITEQPARACVLPQTLRVAAASQQHYGVSMTRGINKSEAPPLARDKLPAGVLAELAGADAALAADPKDPSALAAEAAVFENHKLAANALEPYYKLREQWPDAVWIKQKIFELEEALASQTAAASAASAEGGKTYALLVGISKYAKPELALQFADRDAQTFGELLASPRLGGLPAGNVLVLTDEKATSAAVRNGFEDFLKRRASKGDTVIILLAGHGTVEVPGSKGAYILTYDSDPQDLKSTALPMADLQALFQEQLAKVGRVILFVDVCKAGTIGTIKNTTVNADIQHLEEAEGSLFGLLASRPREVSREGPEFGGGHGAFSYFVIKGLAGEADANKDGVVDVNELIKYVAAQVPQATGDKQHPREFGTFDNLKLSDLKKPGISIARWRMLYDSRNGGPLLVASAGPGGAPFDGESGRDLESFNDALKQRRLLAAGSGGAFAALQKLKAELSPEIYFEQENRLRVALEDEAQKVLLRYLAGDQNPQTRKEFEAGAQYMEAARQLTKESLFLEAREDFFAGRALLFDKRFPRAAELLEQAVRIDPGAAYGYNALGIAYLEQAEFEKAIPAFRDAARRAQHWSYPLHNLALAYQETGDYKGAIRAYEQAMRLTPEYSYLPYNLGLVYQRLNRRKDAEAAYRKAIGIAPGAPQPYNALGTLKASEGKRDEAERLYRQALDKDAGLLPARHNLAILLSSGRGRQPEALDLWRENLKRDPDFIASRISLAEALAAGGDDPAAIQEYRRVLAAKPGYIAARAALAGLLAKTGDAEGALNELRQAAGQEQNSPELFEQIGDLEARRGRAAEARQAYESALSQSPGRAARKRVQNKLRDLR